MLPSAVAAHAGAYWDVVASSSLLNFPAAPGFGNLGKSFLIENLLRAGGAPPLGLPPPQHHGSAAALGAGAQVRSLPASPVPLKLCPAAEPVSPGGAPYGTRWAFQVLSPSADGARLPGRAPGDPDCAFQPPAPGEPVLPSPAAPCASRAAGPPAPVLRNPLGLRASESISSINGDAASGVRRVPPLIVMFLPIPSHQASSSPLLSTSGRATLNFRPFCRNPEVTSGLSRKRSPAPLLWARWTYSTGFPKFSVSTRPLLSRRPRDTRSLESSWLEEPRALALGAFASQTLASVGEVGEHAQRSLEKELRQVLAFSTLKFWIAKAQENRRRVFLRAELEQLNWHLE